MQLLIVRHSDAEARGSMEDARRPLIGKGKKKAEKVARWFRRQYGTPDVLLTSPAVRALETARIFQQEFEMTDDKVIGVDALRPEGEQGEVISGLGNYSSFVSVMLFGHEPNFSSLVSTLLSGEPDDSIHIKKAGICCLNIDSLAEGKCATLEWLLDPAMLPDSGKGKP